MSEHPAPIYDLVRHELSGERQRALSWEGSFQDYLALVEARPAVARNAFQRLIDMIESHGSEKPRRRGAPTRWKLFDDPLGDGEDAVFGLDGPLAELVATLRAGARGLGPERRVI